MLVAVLTLLKRWRMASTMNVRTATCAKRNDRKDVIRRSWQFALRCHLCGVNLPDEVTYGRPERQICAESGIELAKSTLVKQQLGETADGRPDPAVAFPNHVMI